MLFENEAKPVTVSANDTYVVQPKTTFFYVQESGRVLAVEEEEASQIHKKYKQVGVSDGLVFAKAISEAKQIARTTQDKERAQAIIRQGEAAELEVARGHFQVPRDFSRTDNQNRPMNFRTQSLVPPNPRT